MTVTVTCSATGSTGITASASFQVKVAVVSVTLSPPAVSTSPRPNTSCHMRFTATRAISGCSGATSHSASPRRSRPLIKINCAAIPANLIESEFFGHEKGAFTGATRARTGRFEEADGGTLFLDEIGDMSPQLQTKLLRALQERFKVSSACVAQDRGYRPADVDRDGVVSPLDLLLVLLHCLLVLLELYGVHLVLEMLNWDLGLR